MKLVQTFACTSHPFILFIYLAFFSCNSQNKESSESAHLHDDHSASETHSFTLSAEQYQNANIAASVLEYRKLSTVLKANGKLDVPPQNLFSVSTPLAGFLKSTSMLEGMHVSKGTTLAVVEHPEIAQLQQDFIEAHSRYTMVEQELSRQKELNAEQVNSNKILQQTQNDFNIAQARYKALEVKIKIAGIAKDKVLEGNITGSITIKSPINGYVSKVNVNIGKMLNTQDVMFEIIDTQHLHAELNIFEKDIYKIKIGQIVRFALANNADKELTAKIYLIGRAIDNTRSVRVHCHLEQEDKNLLPGMFINASISLDPLKTLAVPVEAVVKENNNDYIFIQEKIVTDKNNSSHKSYTFTKTQVKTGITDGNFIEIEPIATRNPNLMIVTKGASLLLSQLKMSGETEGHNH